MDPGGPQSDHGISLVAAAAVPNNDARGRRPVAPVEPHSPGLRRSRLSLPLCNAPAQIEQQALLHIMIMFQYIPLQVVNGFVFLGLLSISELEGGTSSKRHPSPGLLTSVIKCQPMKICEHLQSIQRRSTKPGRNVRVTSAGKVDPGVHPPRSCEEWYFEILRGSRRDGTGECIPLPNDLKGTKRDVNLSYFGGV